MAFDWAKHDASLLATIWQASDRLAAHGGTGKIMVSYRHRTVANCKTTFSAVRPKVPVSIDIGALIMALIDVHLGALIIREASGSGEQRIDFESGKVVKCETTVRDHLPKNGKAPHPEVGEELQGD